jgi:hypothetical protein
MRRALQRRAEGHSIVGLMYMLYNMTETIVELVAVVVRAHCVALQHCLSLYWCMSHSKCKLGEGARPSDSPAWHVLSAVCLRCIVGSTGSTEFQLRLLKWFAVPVAVCLA